MEVPDVSKATVQTRTPSGTDEEGPCNCLGAGENPYHDELVELLSAPPEFIEWGHRLVMCAHEAGADCELTTLAGCHSWQHQQDVYRLASALQDLATDAEAWRGHRELDRARKQANEAPRAEQVKA
jgi:outer membrane murein-binding lipoprotein Lpp